MGPATEVHRRPAFGDARPSHSFRCGVAPGRRAVDVSKATLEGAFVDELAQGSLIPRDGTRLSVELIVDLLAQGWSEADVLASYPKLTVEDIHACLKYASAVMQSEKVYPLPSR